MSTRDMNARDPNRSKTSIPKPAGYSATPLPKKLGIKPDQRVAILNAPDDFGDLLVPLPDNVKIVGRAQGKNDVIVFFAKSRKTFARRLAHLTDVLETAGALWIAWPKKSSRVATDMTEDVVREIALPTGLVDTKVCAIDATWSGLKLVRRKANR